MLNNLVNTTSVKNLGSTSYASVTKSVKKIEKVPNIVVTAKSNDNRETIVKVKNKLISDLSVPINNVSERKDGIVYVKCKNNDDVSRAKNVLSEKLGSDYSVDVEHLKMPKIKVINVENDLEKDDLCTDIYNRNFLDFDGACNLIADYKNRSGKRILILEVTAESYKYVKDNGFRLYIGHQCCRVFDHFNLNICYKCGRSNHSHKNCNNTVKCLNCAGDHDTKTCTSQIKRCLNCMYYNEKFHKNRSIDHCATDTCCEYLAFKFNQLIAGTDYPVKPTIPKSLGYVGLNATICNL